VSALGHKPTYAVQTRSATLAFEKAGPMPFTEITKITLVASQDVDLHAGIVMPPGSYPATKTRTRVNYLDGSVNWTPTRYRIELSAEQLARMGARVQPIRVRKKSTWQNLYA